MIKLSVIIPAYNPPKDLFQNCIDSILAQNYNDYEVIVIDDGSTKDLADYMDNIAKIDTRIKIIHQKNAGEGAARNAGIKAAIGEYLIFIDADDCVGRRWFDIAISFAEANNSDVVIGKVIGCEKVDEYSSNERIAYITVSKSDLWKIQRDILMEKTDLLDGIEYIDVGSCAKLFKKKVVESLCFPEGVKLSADQVFNHEVLSLCNNYTITNCDSYYYIVNPESISHIHHVDAVDIMMHSMELVKESLINHPEVKRAFYYHVVRDYQKALQFAFFNSKAKRTSLKERYEGIKESLANALVIEAFEAIDKKMFESYADYIKVKLLKNKQIFIYIILKDLYLWAVRNKER